MSGRNNSMGESIVSGTRDGKENPAQSAYSDGPFKQGKRTVSAPKQTMVHNYNFKSNKARESKEAEI